MAKYSGYFPPQTESAVTGTLPVAATTVYVVAGYRWLAPAASRARSLPLPRFRCVQTFGLTRHRITGLGGGLPSELPSETLLCELRAAAA